MRVLQLHNHHLSMGGAMEVLAHEAELLRGAGHDVLTYTIPAAEQMGLSPMRAGLKAIWNEEARRTVKRHVSTFGPDVVHVHTPFPLLSPVVFRAAHELGVPTVTTSHSYRYSCIAGTCWRDGGVCEDCIGKQLKLPGLRHRCYHDSFGASAALTASLALHRSLGTLNSCIDRWIALTGFAKRLLARDGIPPDKIIVKPNSVPDPGPRHWNRDGDAYVAFAARLLAIKGVKTLLDAWQAVPHAGLRLRIAGDGPLRGLVEERIRADDSIEYLGWIGEAEVLALMGGAEAVVVPSEWYEGLPLVILRSLAVGTPVVVSDLENICEDVVADDAGMSFRVGDPTSLAEAITTVTRKNATAEARRNRARASYLARYSPAADLARLEAIYASLTPALSSPT